MAGCALPAASLRDPGIAAWVRTHRLAVIACGDDDLGLTEACGVSPRHVVLRCSPMTATIRHGAASGVVRYVVSTDRQIDVLAGCPAQAKHVYLDDRDPRCSGSAASMSSECIATSTIPGAYPSGVRRRDGCCPGWHC